MGMEGVKTGAFILRFFEVGRGRRQMQASSAPAMQFAAGGGACMRV